MRCIREQDRWHAKVEVWAGKMRNQQRTIGEENRKEAAKRRTEAERKVVQVVGEGRGVEARAGQRRRGFFFFK
jgi:hypothetical protein